MTRRGRGRVGGGGDIILCLPQSFGHRRTLPFRDGAPVRRRRKGGGINNIPFLDDGQFKQKLGTGPKGLTGRTGSNQCVGTQDMWCRESSPTAAPLPNMVRGTDSINPTAVQIALVRCGGKLKSAESAELNTESTCFCVVWEPEMSRWETYGHGLYTMCVHAHPAAVSTSFHVPDARA